MRYRNGISVGIDGRAVGGGRMNKEIEGKGREGKRRQKKGREGEGEVQDQRVY